MECVKKYKKAILLILIFIVLSILAIWIFSNGKQSTTFYENLHAYLSANKYNISKIDEKFLKDNDLYDENFVCNEISYNEGILEFVECSIDEEKKSYCVYDGKSMNCYDRDLESKFEATFSDENIDNTKYVNYDVVLSTEFKENSDLEIDSILYCDTTEESCIPTKTSESYDYILNIESETSKICVMVKYTNEFVSEIICSDNYKIDKTMPEIDYKIEGTKGENGWYISDVEISEYNATDSLSGIKSYNINKTIINRETKGENIIITAEDFAGNIIKEVIDIKIDKTAPVAGDFVINGIEGLNGWYKSDINVSTMGGKDDISSIKSVTVDKNIIDYETDGDIVTLTTTDNAGHTTTKSITLKVDKTVPVIDYEILGTKGDNDWYISDVEITKISVTDNLSGIKSHNINKSLINYETKGEDIIITAEDLAGNKVEEIVNIKIDKVAPIAGNFDITGDSAFNGWYRSDLTIVGSGGLDNISGISSTVVSKDSIDYETSGEVVTLTTTDNAGHSTTKNITLMVDKTKPVIDYTIDGTEGDNDWYVTDVDIINYSANDNLSSIKNFDISNTMINYETAGENIVIIAEDLAGNVTEEIVNIKVDKTPPAAKFFFIRGTKGSNDWYTTDLTISTSGGFDALSGLAATSLSKDKIDYETTGEVVTLITEDNAGNSASRTINIKVDKSLPTIEAISGDVEIKIGTSTSSSDYFTTTYGISGGSVECTPANINTLSQGSSTISCEITSGSGKKVTATKEITILQDYKEDILSGSDPNLTPGLYPVTIDSNGDVTIADVNDEWYNYSEKIWANAITLKSGETVNVGDVLTDDTKIAAYYVWIPRYEYQIFDVEAGEIGKEDQGNEQEINIRFVSKTTEKNITPTLDSWYTHPAFTVDGTEIDGFWMGKFEITGTVDIPTTLPGLGSIRSQTILGYYNSIIDMDTDYGLSNNINEVDSHMIKNDEWGAMAYLSHSVYGINQEIWINSNNTYTTACGSLSSSAGASSNCDNAYGTVTENVYNQSTTGNISGIFDVSGSTWEYVMSNTNNSLNSFNSGNSGFGNNPPPSRYYDSYEYGTSTLTFSRGQYGDATREVTGWYDDFSFMMNHTKPWFIRGGDYSNSTECGAFAFTRNTGNAFLYTTSRASLWIY